MLRDRLDRIYGAHLDEAGLDALTAVVGEIFPGAVDRGAWSADDVVLITYGNTVHRRYADTAVGAISDVGGRSPDETPLQALHHLLLNELAGAISTVHVLPFSPFSSDDGFSVIDYLAVDGRHGTWADIEAIAETHALMVDLVANHISQEHDWFQQFLAGVEPGRSAIMTAPPDADISMVTRPRTHPLLRPVETPDGERQVWCTFSHDQIDVDFSNPAVLIEYLKIAAAYARHGARVVRLDAIAYLWKELGTTCVHRPQTHEIVRVFRDVAGRSMQIITETNVPLAENLSYFGDGDEADAVYNFSLPPLMLDAFAQGDATLLRHWLDTLPTAPKGAAVLNFLASHDGVGLRPAEGLLPIDRIDALVQRCVERGGAVSSYAVDGGSMPYELNIALLDMLGGPAQLLAAHAAMVAMAGVPAVYIHSLLATPNDHEQMARSGHNRGINRGFVSLEAIRAAIADPASPTAVVLPALCNLLRLRRAQPAFHPAAQQVVLPGPAEVLAFERITAEQHLTVCVNVSGIPQPIEFRGHDLIAGGPFAGSLAPYQAVWLTAEPSR